MKDKLYYFIFLDNNTQRTETLEIKAKTFAEALPSAHVHRASLNQTFSKSNWDVVSVNSKLA